MTIRKLIRTDLIPETESYRELFENLKPIKEDGSLFNNVQTRLCSAIKQFLHPYSSYPFMLLKAPEEIGYLKLITDVMRQLQPKNKDIFGGRYNISENLVTFEPSTHADGRFAVNSGVVSVDWVESEQFFGYFRKFNNNIALYPGLLHSANGGVLIISLRTLLTQPLLWMRLKSVVSHQRFDWITSSEFNPLPIRIPPIPFTIKVVLVGSRTSLASFQEIEPEISGLAAYGEFEDNICITSKKDIELWCHWVYNIARLGQFPIPTKDVWPALICEAVRYTGDHAILPLCLLWLNKQLSEVCTISGPIQFDKEQFLQMISRRKWNEGFLIKCMQNNILFEQIALDTDGKKVGQINTLSIIEFPGYPNHFGEPMRVSCVAYIGDGEFINIENKVELSSNIHTKGIMIIKAFLITQLKLEQNIPFSISITFEQSYNEIDGDSVSMAELCAIISALANVPISQSIAITASVDQFGRAQSVDGLNEKIESFFYICEKRGLTGKQGVIIPITNIRSLSLSQNLLLAIEKGEFSIWAIEDIKDALFLLTNFLWDGEKKITLMKIIQNRIEKVIKKNKKYYFPWLSYLLNWFD